MTLSTFDKARLFSDLHSTESLFVMPCAWDVFSAILFEHAGFRCLGTTSGGVNWVRGRKDYVYSTPRDTMLDTYGEIAHASGLPVSGDLENGYGVEPDEVAATISAAINKGLVGGSIEDQDEVPNDDAGVNGQLFELDLAVERIKAARLAADAADYPFTLTARCEVYYTQHNDPYPEAVKRLNAYREAGADCLFVPGLNKPDLLKQLVKDVNGPISFGLGATAEPLSLPMLEDLGIRRVSTGGGLTRATFALLERAANCLRENGTADYLNDAVSEADINTLLDRYMR